MNKRAFLLTFLLIGPVLFVSCMVHKINQEKLGAIERWRNSGATIYAVQKTSGEHIEFSKKRPAHIKEDHVVGSVLEETLIERSKLKGVTVDSKGKLLEITPQDGKTYQVVYGKIEGDKVRYVTNSSPMHTVSIPLSEIELVWVKRINTIATLTTNLVIVSAVALLGVVGFSGAAEPPPPPTGGIGIVPIHLFL